jgi:sec-independent protein translocase protein TatC
VLAALGEERKEIEIEVDKQRLAELLGLAAGPDSDAAPQFAPLPARMSAKTWVMLIDETQRLLAPPPSLRTLGPTEAMMVYFKTALVCGVVLGSPWIFWQLWAFVAAGLYPHEKRLVHVHLPFAVGLFLGGVLFCQFLVMPRAVAALLAFNEWLGFQPDLRLSEWVSFAVLMPVVFGVAFQTPLVMRLLERLGILTVADYREHRRMAWFVMAVAAAVITPSLDAVNLLFLWVPMGLLYELGILLCRLAPRERVESPALDAGELVEV